jgi:cytochrome c556
MLRLVAAAAAIIVGATIVYAQNAGVIAQRKQAMKAYGGAAKAVGPMFKGEAPFDQAKVTEALKTIQAKAAEAKNLFTDDSKVGDTDALPEAFANKADLMAKFDKIAADAKAAEAAIKDEATLKSEWPKVTSNCGGCHKAYRKPPKS